MGGLSKPDRILGHCGRETLSARLNEIQAENPNQRSMRVWHAAGLKTRQMPKSAFDVDSLPQEDISLN